MKLLMCNCRQCRYGRKSSRNRYLIRHKISGYRSRVKRMIKTGKFDDLLVSVPIGYTD